MSNHSKQFLEKILNGVSYPIFVKDSNLKFVFINEAFTRLTGLVDDDILGRDDYDFFPKEQADIFKAIDESVLITGKENFNEEKLLRPDGVSLTLNTGKNRLIDESGNRFIVGNIFDTTEKKKLIDNLKVSNQMLKQYAHLVSHDLKSPIITIRRFSQLLSRSLGSKLNASETEYLDFITNSSLRLFELVVKILDFSHLNTQDLQFVTADTSKLIAEVKSDLSVIIENENCLIELKNLPDELICDKRLMYSVFQNLVSNAIKFKSADRNCLVEISCIHNEANYLFTVSDNGVGLEQDIQKKIFEMFARLNSNPSISGSGIGLALCKMIVEKHGGEIWVESEFGKGSQFKFTIPNNLTVTS